MSLIKFLLFKSSIHRTWDVLESGVDRNEKLRHFMLSAARLIPLRLFVEIKLAAVFYQKGQKKKNKKIGYSVNAKMAFCLSHNCRDGYFRRRFEFKATIVWAPRFSTSLKIWFGLYFGNLIVEFDPHLKTDIKTILVIIW